MFKDAYMFIKCSEDYENFAVSASDSEFIF